jgi:hypothetical protein
MHYGRLATNLVITGACVALIALEIAGPRDPTPARPPADTFTHIDVRVDDNGVHVPVHNAPAGEVEVTLTDARTKANAALTVTSSPHALRLHAGTQLVTMRDLTTYELRANAGAHAMRGTDWLKIVMPRLDAAREPANRVTVNIDTSGMSTPYRDARFEAPTTNAGPDGPGASIPWTTVGVGSATVVLHNHRTTALKCTVDGVQTAIPSGATRSVAVTFARGESFVDCGATKLDLEA